MKFSSVRLRRRLPFLIIVLLMSAGVRADFTNGTFSTGDFTGWTLYLTANGANNSPSVTSFSVTGLGAGPAATFNVGNAASTGGSTYTGGGLAQSLLLTPGLYRVNAYIASQDSPHGPNGEMGLFSIIANGTTLDSDDFGASTAANSIDRGLLTGYLAVNSTSSDNFQFQVTRNFLPGLGTTPEEYITDISLTQMVPEPASISAVVAGGAILSLRRRRASVV